MNLLRSLAVVFSLFALGGFVDGSIEGDNSFETLNLGQYTFRIPKNNAMTTGVPAWLRWLPGLDDGSNSALFRFRDREIKRNVPDYRVSERPFRDDIEVLMMVLTPEEVRRYDNSETFAELGDLWRGQGSYKKRRIESFGDRWYKVYYSDQASYSWVLLKQFPDGNRPLPDRPLDFWVAHCFLHKALNEVSASCKSHVLLENILLEFRLSEYNLPVIDQVREFLKNKVLQWKQSG